MSETNAPLDLQLLSKDLNLEDSYQFSTLCLRLLDSLKTRDLVSIEVSKHSSLTDYMLIGTGTSSRHVVAIAFKLEEKLKELGFKDLMISGQESGEWVIVDCGLVMIHLMLESVRERYQLDDLYRCLAIGQFSELEDAS
ncbi:MAG: ribosome silencing factor [Succinivibrio sp.]|nr:ribosome silencing factor [Succinivibrio sp.]